VGTYIVFGKSVRKTRSENHDHTHAFTETASERGIVKVTAPQSEYVVVYLEVGKRLEFACQGLVQFLYEPRHEFFLAVAVTYATGVANRHARSNQV
jgi:hypothetical protein